MKTLAILLAFLPAALQAACPTRADLSDGIVLVRNAPFLRSDFQRFGRWLVELRAHRTGAEAAQTRLLFDHPLILRERIDTDQRHTKRHYANDIGALDRLDQIGRFSSPVAILNDEAEPVTGQITLEFEGRGEVAFAECRYETWQIRHETRLDDGRILTDRRSYAPDLGLVVGIATNGNAPEITYSWIGTFADVAR